MSYPSAACPVCESPIACIPMASGKLVDWECQACDMKIMNVRHRCPLCSGPSKLWSYTRGNDPDFLLLWECTKCDFIYDHDHRGAIAPQPVEVSLDDLLSEFAEQLADGQFNQMGRGPTDDMVMP